MVLTQLEADLLVELATRGRRVRELLEFVALHGDRDKSVAATVTLDNLLECWTARGWLAVGEVRDADVAEGVVADARVRRAATRLPAGSMDGMLWLTEVVWREVPWLPRPSSGALHREPRAGLGDQ